jgi:hypothetical protein
MVAVYEILLSTLRPVSQPWGLHARHQSQIGRQAGFFQEFCVCRFASAHWANFRDFLLLTQTGKRKCVMSDTWYKMDNIEHRMSRKQRSISI